MEAKIVRPRIVAFEMTQRCPLHCRHCRAGAEQTTKDVLSTDDCVKIIQSLADYNICVVILTGGEPLARPDLFEILEKSADTRVTFSLATCGYFYDEPMAKRLRELGVVYVSFSIDGASAAEHDAFRGVEGAYAMTMKAVEAAKSAGMRFQINTTVTTLNAGQVKQIAQTAAELGAICWNPFIFVPVGRGEAIRDLLLGADEYERLLEELTELRNILPIELRLTCGPQFARVARQKKARNAEKVRGCLAAGDFAFVSYRGDVQTCGFLEISAGNLVENGFRFDLIWNESPYLNSLRDLSRYEGACGECGYLPVCRGCRARAMAITGSHFGQDPICKLGEIEGRNRE